MIIYISCIVIYECHNIHRHLYFILAHLNEEIGFLSMKLRCV